MAVLLVAYAGLSILCLTVTRHGQALWRWPVVRHLTELRVIGWSLLGVSFAVCCMSLDGSAIVTWFGTMSISGVILAMLSASVPRAIGATAIVAMLGAVSLMCLR